MPSLPRRSADDQVTATFLRGLTVGALVGAVVAGSSLLGRRRAATRATDVAEPQPDVAEPRPDDPTTHPTSDPAAPAPQEEPRP